MSRVLQVPRGHRIPSPALKSANTTVGNETAVPVERDVSAISFPGDAPDQISRMSGLTRFQLLRDEPGGPVLDSVLVVLIEGVGARVAQPSETCVVGGDFVPIEGVSPGTGH